MISLQLYHKDFKSFNLVPVYSSSIMKKKWIYKAKLVNQIATTNSILAKDDILYGKT